MDILKSLNKQQINAVKADPGPVLVLAGPGSGKTRVLTHRAAYLIGELGIQPYHILAVTFTNKAASEMEDRITDLLGIDAHGLTLGTFHSTCARYLRMEAEYLQVTPNYVIFDADDQLRVVKRIFKDLEINGDEAENKTKENHYGVVYRPQAILAEISTAKNDLRLPEDLPRESELERIIAEVYVEYQKILLQSNALDFDDLLMQFAILLRDHDKIREKYARRYQHILVDEFQDTNMAQYTLLNLMASYHGNLFVVGDPDQSIYRWRGADYRNINRFEGDYPDAEVILLEQNYRSTQNILDTAMSIIDRNSNRTPKKLFTDRGPGEKILIKEAYDDQQQAEFVIEIISKQTRVNKVSPADFAVMYRTNAQSRILEEAFIKADIPHKLVGAQRFYGRREVKDIVAYLRLVVNPSDIVSLRRVINTPRRKIGEKTFGTLVSVAESLGISPGELLLRLGGKDPVEMDSFSPAAGKSLAGFGQQLLRWRKKYETLPPVEIVHQIITDIEYREYLEHSTKEGFERWENVVELERIANERQSVGLHDFLERVALISDQDTIEPDQEVATLLTLHAAKGLEFKQVMIIGVNEGIIPHQRSFADPEAMEEERRLFYVGITRAKDRLMLFHSLRRLSYAGYEYLDASRYYEDISLELRTEYYQSNSYGSQPKPVTTYSSWKEAQQEDKRPVASEQEYSPGEKVSHAKFGEGLVINSELRDDDEIVTIVFEGLEKGDQQRMFIASLVELKKIS